jgi:hypothetical protein
MSALLRASLRQVSVRRGATPRRFMSSEPEKGWVRCYFTAGK